MAMDSALATALEQPLVRVFTAVRIELPDRSINLVDGNHKVSFTANGEVATFEGEDPDFGFLRAVSPISEGFATEAPSLQISLNTPSRDANVDLMAITLQGAPVFVYFGVVGDNGVCIGAPELLYAGAIDQALTQSDHNSRYLEMEIASALEELFIVNEGQLLNGSWHRKIWPGETGLDYVQHAMGDALWGAEGTKTSAVTTRPGGLPSGGGSKS